MKAVPSNIDLASLDVTNVLPQTASEPDNSSSIPSSSTIPEETLAISGSVHYKSDTHGVTAEEFAEAVARYNHTNRQASMAYAKGEIVEDAPANPMGDDFNDARSCWFSLDRLKKFVHSVEAYSKMANIDIDKLGIRCYYATYPGHSEGLWNHEYAGCHTLYLTPTYNNGKFNEDFDPEISAARGEAVKLSDLITSEDVQQKLFLMGGSKPTNLFLNDGVCDAFMNQGDLCPPSNLDTQYSDGNGTLQSIDSRIEDIGY